MRRKWVYRPGHPKASANGFVAWEDLYGSSPEETKAVHAPILSGRFFENTQATDGTDIGSRRKHADYMKRTGLAPASDFSPGWYERQRKERESTDKRERRETISRAVWQEFDQRRR